MNNRDALISEYTYLNFLKEKDENLREAYSAGFIPTLIVTALGGYLEQNWILYVGIFTLLAPPISMAYSEHEIMQTNRRIKNLQNSSSLFKDKNTLQQHSEVADKIKEERLSLSI